VWARRRARALALAETTPHAREILETYAGIVSAQEQAAEEAPEGWDAVVGWRAVQGRVDELEPLFRSFLERVRGVGTTVMREQAEALLAVTAEERAEQLGEGEAIEHDVGVHVRAFVEAVATELAGRQVHAPGGGETGEGAAGGVDSAQGCPVCGGLPVVGVLRDEPDAQGALSLVCATCATEWRAPRLTCVSCGETDSGALQVHVAESLPHLRIDACASCGRYLKVVDLRQRGDAVPVVDEVASVELDVWAAEQGLRKVRRNAVGL
jgi:formate dehydrogenase accessory protein FdhE